jgi:ATP-dependent Clp protease ATP-binding subunit ClpA
MSGRDIDMPNLYRYSHHAKRALSYAGDLALQYGHPHIDTAHLLVGVVLTDGSIGAEVLRKAELSEQLARVYLKRLMKTETIQDRKSIPEHESYHQALDLSEDESLWLGNHYIGTEHLLLGITRTNVGNAIHLLKLVDITPEQIRRYVRLSLSDGSTEFTLAMARRNARLSEIGRRTLYATEQLAIARDQEQVGLGHLLMALAQEKRGVTASVLEQSDLKFTELAHDIDDPAPQLKLSMEQVIFRAVEEAEKHSNHYVGADHLLYAMTLLPNSRTLMEAYAVRVDKVQRLLEKRLSQ